MAEEDYAIMFDESLNETTKNKQMDLHIRFGITNKNGSHVQSRYFSSQFMAHSKVGFCHLLFDFSINMYDRKYIKLKASWFLYLSIL